MKRFNLELSLRLLSVLPLFFLVAFPAAAQDKFTREVGVAGGAANNAGSMGDYNVVGVGKTIHILDKFDRKVSEYKFRKKVTSLSAVSNGKGVRAIFVSTSDGLYIINASDPKNPGLNGFIPTPASAPILKVLPDMQSAVTGKPTTTCAIWGGVAQFRTDSQTQATELGHIAIPYQIQDAALLGHQNAFVAVGFGGLHCYNTAQPTPVLNFTSSSLKAYGLFIDGNIMGVTDGYTGGLNIVQVTEQDTYTTSTAYKSPLLTPITKLTLPGAALKATCVHTPPSFEYDGWPFPVHQKPQLATSYTSPLRAMVCASNYGVHIVNLADPAHPFREKTITTPFSAVNVAATTSTALISDPSTGCMIYDISDPLNPTLRGVDPGFNAQDSLLAGSYLYVAAGDMGGIRVFRLDAGGPVPVGQGLVGLNTFYALKPYDATTILAAGQGGLAVVDISNPTTPTLAGSFYCSTFKGLDVTGHYALLPSGVNPNKITVVDLANRANPVSVRGFAPALPNNASPNDVALSGSYAYFSASSAGVSVMSLSDPTSPTTVGLIVPPQVGAFGNYFLGVAARGNLLAIAASGGGFHIYNVANPAAPVRLYSNGDILCNSVGFTSDGRLMVSASAGQLIVYDLTDPAHPLDIAEATVPDNPGRARWFAGRAFVACAEGGLMIYEIMNHARDWMGYR